MSRYLAGRFVPVVAAALALTVALAGALWWAGSREPSAGPPPSVPSPSAFAAGALVATAPTRSVPAVDVLHRWDLARARAYAAGDVAGLRALYVSGSSAGTTDARLLRSYETRGLRVQGMRMQLLAVQVLAHSPHRWRLRVTDRLTGAVAVGGGVRQPLPRDRASTRVVTLRRTSRRAPWQVASVR